MDAAGALLFKARLARRSAASRLSSACFVGTVAVCAARRWAELGGCFVGCTDTVTLFLAAINCLRSSIFLTSILGRGRPGGVVAGGGGGVVFVFGCGGRG